MVSSSRLLTADAQTPPPAALIDFISHVDADGDGTSTAADRAVLSWWLASGGDLTLALSSAVSIDGLYDLSSFLASPTSQLPGGEGAGAIPWLGVGGTGYNIASGPANDFQSNPALEPGLPLLTEFTTAADNGDIGVLVESIIPLDVNLDPRRLVFPFQIVGGVIDRGADEYSPEEVFIRGDANDDQSVDIADVILLLDSLFGPNYPAVACKDAGDVNDDASMNIADAISLLAYLFSAGPAPPYPFPSCDGEATPDFLRSCIYNSCPP